MLLLAAFELVSDYCCMTVSDMSFADELLHSCIIFVLVDACLCLHDEHLAMSVCTIMVRRKGSSNKFLLLLQDDNNLFSVYT